MKKPACIIRPHKAGLWSLINNVATCGEFYDHVAVDWNGDYDNPDLLYKGRGNLWEYLFVNQGAFACRADETEIISGYPDQHLTYKHVAKHYLDPKDPWRTVYNAHWRSWGVHPAWVARAGKFIGDIGGPYVAVQIRSVHHAGEQVNGTPQGYADYAASAAKALRETREQTEREPTLVVVASDHESIRYFHEMFPKVASYPHSRRAYKRADPDFHLTHPQTFEDAAHCLVEVMVMSQACVLVHPVSNMATGALYLNPNLRSVYLP